MPDIGPYHPIIVHFAIVLLLVGCVFRWVSLTRRIAFASPAATTLLLAGTLAGAVAVRSGLDAHGPVERVPGAASAVGAHEEWGIRARNMFFFVALAELVVLVLARRGKERIPIFVSSALCAAGLVCLYEAAEHGGELVYSYAGGVGIQSGQPEDVGRLLLAGLYHQALLDRKAGRGADAAALVDTAAQRFPSEIDVQLLAAESQLLDRRDPRAALARLGTVNVPKDNRRARLRHAFLTADALEAAGQPEGARATLQALRSEFPDNAALRRRLEGH
jgi:uncharacterized membrane protein